MGRNTKRPIIYGFILACLLVLASLSPVQAQSCPTPDQPLVSSDGRLIINSYTAVTDICGNTFEVTSARCFSEGDEVMIIQMQGATTVYNETDESGTVEEEDYGSAGLYELNTVRSVSGNRIVFDQVVVNEYEISGKVQIVSVPNVGNQVLTRAYTCKEWNGTVGGVLAFSGGRLILGASIDVSGKGFRGGRAFNFPRDCEEQRYNYPPPNTAMFTGTATGEKGEGITETPFNSRHGAGRSSSGGGGGNLHNGGGGGGGGARAGGRGGERDSSCSPRASIGGQALVPGTSRLFMGGGGGAGHANNNHLKDGGNGGGIIFIRGKSISTFIGFVLNAKGENGKFGVNASFHGDDHHDGGGGGGGGGTIMLDLEDGATGLVVNVAGGKGSDVDNNHGAGGGGGGGWFFYNRPTLNGIHILLHGGERGESSTDSSHGVTGGMGRKKINYTSIAPTDRYVSPAIISAEATAECDSTSILVIDYEATNGELLINNQPATGEVFTGLTTGDYQIKLTNGCDTVREEISVQNYPILGTALLRAEPFICDRPGAAEVVQTGGKPTYVFTLNDSLSQSNGLFPGLGVGEYWVTVTDDLGCQASRMVQIVDSSYTLFPLLPERVIEQRGETFVLPLEISSPYPPIRYEWSPGEFFIDSVGTTPELLSPTQYNGAISLRVTDAVGCTGASGTEILITNPKFYVPTAFSPNGDDLNETLLFQSNPTLEGRMVEFRIFNRWGGVVYDWCKDADGEERRCVPDLFGPLNGIVLWDGFFLGTPAEVGVYPYHLVVELADSSRYKIKGITNLIR